MKYNHTIRISLPCYEYAFRTWPLYEWSVNTENIQSYCQLEHSNTSNFS